MSFEGTHPKEEKCEDTYKRYVLYLPLLKFEMLILVSSFVKILC
jgi:hypothetical protein